MVYDAKQDGYISLLYGLLGATGSNISIALTNIGPMGLIGETGVVFFISEGSAIVELNMCTVQVRHMSISQANAHGLRIVLFGEYMIWPQ